MTLLHRAIFTWFMLLVFLILLCLRLESRTHWNWFIVFVPMWIYDAILQTYALFHAITRCKNNGARSSRGGGASLRNARIESDVRYMIGVALKMCAQIVVCAKLEYAGRGGGGGGGGGSGGAVHVPAYAALAPLWLLLPLVMTSVVRHLIKNDPSL